MKSLGASMFLLLAASLSPRSFAQVSTGAEALKELAAKEAGTSAAKAERLVRGDQLIGCDFSFTQTLQDFAYRGGLPTVVVGNLVVTSALEGGGVLLKLGLRDLVPAGDQVRTEEKMPAGALLSFPSGSIRAARATSTSRCPDSAMLCSLYSADEMAPVLRALPSGTVVVGYRRDLKGPEVRFTLRPADVEGGAGAIDALRACLSELRGPG